MRKYIIYISFCIIFILSTLLIKNYLLYIQKGIQVSKHYFSLYSLQENIVKVRHPKKGLLNIGIAIYGLTSNSFNCDNFFKVMRKVPEWHISFLYNTFGNNFECLKRILDESKTRTIQVHLINEVSPRNGDAQAYEFHKAYSLEEFNKAWKEKDPKLLKKFYKYVRPLQKLFETYLPNRPHIKCIIGPGLESNVHKLASKNMVATAKRAFPYCKVSWNGMKAKASNADYIEQHGSNPYISAPCIVDLDGEDIHFSKRSTTAWDDGVEWTAAVTTGNLRTYAQRLANRCDIYYLWTWESNCSVTGVRRDSDQRNRDCGHPQINLVMKLISKEIKWLNKNGIVRPEIYNWSYDEKLSLQLCSKIKKRQIKIFTIENGGYIKIPIFYNITNLYVIYKQNLIDVYELNRIEGTKQIWLSNIKPNKRYPYKVVLAGTTVGTDGISSSTCWKINNPFTKKVRFLN